MAALLKAGAALNVIAQRWEISQSAMTARLKCLRRNGFVPFDMPLFNTSHTSDQRHDEQICKMFKRRMGPDEIAGELYVTGTFVRKRMSALRLLEPPAKEKRLACAPEGKYDMRPRGWLMTEGQLNAAYARAGGRFQDVRLAR